MVKILTEKNFIFFAIFVLLICFTMIFQGKVAVPAPTGLEFDMSVVHNENDIDIEVREGQFFFHKNQIKITIRGKIKLSENWKDKELTCDETTLGFAALKKYEYPSFVDLLTEENNYFEIFSQKNPSRKIKEREDTLGYKYVCEIPLKNVPSDYTDFIAILHFKSPKIAEDIYIKINPSFFEANLDQKEFSEEFSLEIANNEYYFEDTPCYAVIGLRADDFPKRVFAKIVFEKDKEYWFHIVKRESKNWPIALAGVIFFITLCITRLQYLITKEGQEKLLYELKMKYGYWVKYEETWMKKIIRKLHELFRMDN